MRTASRTGVPALLLLLLLFTGSVYGQSAPEFPPSLGDESMTLLVKDADQNKVSKCLEETMEKYYKGKYIIAPSAGLYATYKDVAKYRYVLVIFTRDVPGQWIGRERFPPTTDYSYGIFDRETSIQHRLSYWAGGYKKSMITFVKKLEEIRSGQAE